ncbi:MAG: nucleotidyltransferase domain-containing protein [Clostridiales bacterium]|nr:nucleotidyltransferase domain-containing protein [Clostridiales bacterium]
MNAAEIKEKIKKHLEMQPDISAAYIFGSMAKGNTRKDSDIDVALLFVPNKEKMERFERRLELGIDLEKITSRQVDIVDLENAPLVLQYQIRKYGILFLEKDHRYRVKFEVSSRRRYFDMIEVYKRRNIALLKRLGD